MQIDKNISWERVHRLAKESLIKEKVYLKPGEKPPEGVRMQRGPKGGLYYETKAIGAPRKEPSKKIPEKLISEKTLQSLTSREKEKVIPKATQEILHILMDDDDPSIRATVTLHIDQEGLYHLARDRDENVRSYVSSRIDEKGLSLLLDAKKSSTRVNVAERIGQKGLLQLLADDDLYVGEIAVKRLYEMDAFSDMIKDSRPRARFNIALNVNPKDAKFLFKDSDDEVRKFAASMSRVSDLSKLLHDSSVEVREIVADRISQKSLHKLIHDKDVSVRKKVVMRIDETGVKEMCNDNDSEIANIAKSKLSEDIPYEKILSNYTKTGEFKLPEGISNKIKNLSKHENFRIQVQNFVDTVFLHANLQNLNQVFRDSWQEMDGKADRAGEYFLNDSVERVFKGNKEVDREMDSYYTEYDTTREAVDKYVKLHKSISKACLDLQFPATDEISLYRGTSKHETAGEKETRQESVTIKSSPMSAWTSLKEVANNYPMQEPGIMLETKVKKDDIWANFLSWGNDGTAPDQREFLVISAKDRQGDIIGETEGMYGEHKVEFDEELPEFED